MTALEFQERIRKRQRVYGTLVTSPSPLFVNAAKNAGLDFVFIDTEHTVLDWETVAWMCIAYGSSGMVPMVRIPSPDPYLASRMIDAGAKGILAPYIETVEQINQLRGAIKYRPLKGVKLQGFLNGDIELNEKELAYFKKYNAGNMLFINIESIAAVQDLDLLLSVPDIDGIIIGPHDLSVSIGHPCEYEHPEFTEAVETIYETAVAHGISAGNHFSFGYEKHIKWCKQGMNIVLNSSDIVTFFNYTAEELDSIRKANKDDLPVNRQTDINL